jgi:tRNA 2-thiouridine synthesizing protein A
MSDTNDIITVDARGLACPEPLMRAKSALNRSGGKAVEVTVDTATSRDNILRMAKREGRDAAARADGDLFVIRIEARRV